jgi:Ohr subfamily peroxiredoxin
MAKTLYTAQAHVTGGRDHGHGRAASGHVDVDLRVPKDVGGDGAGTNPEELFAVGYASCFDSALNTVARRMKLKPGETSVDSSVSLMAGEDRSFKLGVQLDVQIPGLSEDDEQAVELVRAAHKVCPYSNATRGNIDVALTANGRPVE